MSKAQTVRNLLHRAVPVIRDDFDFAIDPWSDHETTDAELAHVASLSDAEFAALDQAMDDQAEALISAILVAVRAQEDRKGLLLILARQALWHVENMLAINIGLLASPDPIPERDSVLECVTLVFQLRKALGMRWS